MSPKPDVLVVGGGPAGSTAARLLARRGWSVSLIDRAGFPRGKACGECLNPGAVEALERLGVLDRVLALEPAMLLGWTLESAGRSATGSFPGGAIGLAVDRARFDAALLEAAVEAGVRAEEGARAISLVGNGVVVRRGSGAPAVAAARVVVGADGLRSVIARGVGAYRRAPRLRKLSVTLHVEGVDADPKRGRLVLDARGTIGLAPLDADGRRWNATVVVDADAGREAAGDSARFALRRLSEGGVVVAPSRVQDVWTSGPFDWPGRRAASDGVVLVGDAAGYYDPLTGQGIYRALRSAELAADAIDAALRRGPVDAASLAGYDRALRREMRAPLLVQRGVEAVVSGGLLRPAALGLLGRAPGALDTIIGVTGDMTPARALLAAEFWSELVSPRSRA